MMLFIASLAILFASTITGFLLVKPPEQFWMPRDLPGLGFGLSVSTSLLVAISIFLQMALGDARRDRRDRLYKLMAFSLALAVAFLISQAHNWWAVHGAARPAMAAASASLPHGFFYFLTGLHALHVIGGLAPLLVVAARARHAAYDSNSHLGILICAIYWHFLDGVWLATLAVLLL